jgi:hypothetical protein
MSTQATPLKPCPLKKSYNQDIRQSEQERGNGKQRILKHYALDYSSHLIDSVAPWFFISYRWRFDPRYPGDRSDCSNNQTGDRSSSLIHTNHAPQDSLHPINGFTADLEFQPRQVSPAT